MDDGGTYLEDFIQSVELLPNDIRRDFELMRVLDKDCIEMRAEVSKLEEDFLIFTKCNQVDGEEVREVSNTVFAKAKLVKISLLREKLKQKLADKTAVASNINTAMDSYTKKLDGDLAQFEAELRGCGEFIVQTSIEPGSEVAIRPNHLSPEWILGRVIAYHSDMGVYEVVDVDDSKLLKLPETQVITLDVPNMDAIRKLNKNDEVLAVYPDTSTFYPATLSQAPRRTGVGVGGITGGLEPIVMVQFRGDELDELGQVPVKTVILKYVIRPPIY